MLLPSSGLNHFKVVHNHKTTWRSKPENHNKNIAVLVFAAQ
jgi:hypothetical protein